MQYTADDKQQALDAYTAHGATQASTLTNIPSRTIQRWAKAASIVSHANQEKTTQARAAAAKEVSEVWADYRSKEAAASGATASRLRNAILEQVEGEPIMEDREREDGTPIQVMVGRTVDGRNLQSLAVAYGILVDKAELLSGNATERIESFAVSEADVALRELVVQMEDTIRSAAG